MDYTYTHNEQEKDEERGMPIVVLKGEKAKAITAKVAPSKGEDAHAVESVRKAVEQLGRRRIILKSDKEPAILALRRR